MLTCCGHATVKIELVKSVDGQSIICREVLYENGPDSRPRVTGLRMSKAGQEQLVEADAYVAALDVPGAKKLIPQVRRSNPTILSTAELYNASRRTSWSCAGRSLAAAMCSAIA